MARKLKNITFTAPITFSDFCALNRYLSLKNKIVYIYWFLGAVSIIGSINNFLHDWWAGWLLVIGVGFSFVFYVYTYLPLFAKNKYKKIPFYREDFSYEISKEGILMGNRMMRSYFSWKVFRGYKMTKDYLFLEFSGIGAIALKKTYLKDDDVAAILQNVKEK